MRIEYNLTSDDWEAFGDYCVDHAPSFTKARRQAQFMVVFFGGIFGSAIGAYYGVLWPLWIGLGIGVGGALYQIPRDIKKSTRDFVLRQRAIARQGRHVADARPDGLHTENDVASTRLNWAMIDRIDETPTHVFIMLAEASGYVIPRGPIPTSDLTQFVEAARAHMLNQKVRA